MCFCAISVPAIMAIDCGLLLVVAIIPEKSHLLSKVTPASDEPGVADGVVRRAERAAHDERGIAVEHPGHGVDLGDFERLVEGQRRQHGWDALGEHGLAAAGRADKKQVVAASGGDLDGALGVLLALDLGEVALGHGLPGPERVHVDHGGRGRVLVCNGAGDEAHGLGQAVHAKDA